LKLSAYSERLDCLLVVPPFWDPLCVPLGPAALNAYVKEHGYTCDIFDFNTVPEIFALQNMYFRELERQFPRWKNLSVDRNGTEIFALHQILYLRARGSCRYVDMCREILGVGSWSGIEFNFRPERFDFIFATLFNRVRSLLGELLDARNPRVLGISLYNSTWPSTCYIAQIARCLQSDVKIVVGGPGPVMGISSRREDVAHFLVSTPQIDHYVLGEGEDALLQILREPVLDERIITSGASASIVSSEKILSLHDLPDPDYGSLDIDSYLHLSISSARGCPYECSFCAETVFWRGFRSIKRSTLLSRVDLLAKRYGRGSFYICDSLSNQSIGPLTEACLKEGRNYMFDCYLRADKSCASANAANRWREGGLKRARLGLESASQRILNEMVKHTDVEQMQQALASLSSAGVRTSTLWIVGYPGETEQEFAESIRFIKENKNSIYQADAWTFQYSPAGLAGSASLDQRGVVPRFSCDLDAILGVQFYSLAGDMTTEERIDRLERFVVRMGELGVPNPYSLLQMRVAEQRWSAMGRT